jgi:hypothetical protein
MSPHTSSLGAGSPHVHRGLYAHSQGCGVTRGLFDRHARTAVLVERLPVAGDSIHDNRKQERQEDHVNDHVSGAHAARDRAVLAVRVDDVVRPRTTKGCRTRDPVYRGARRGGHSCRAAVKNCSATSPQRRDHNDPHRFSHSATLHDLSGPALSSSAVALPSPRQPLTLPAGSRGAGPTFSTRFA